jgi:hypothetical protein
MFNRLFPALAAFCIIGNTAARGQSANAEGPEVPERTYQLLREDEDWTFLRNRSLRRDFWDPLKYIPLRNGAD